jgi:Cytochrome C oxidase, cbb3-type, subunit III
MSDFSQGVRPLGWRSLARAAVAGLGLLILGCGGREKESTAMRDTGQASPSVDTSGAGRADSAAAAPVDTSRPTPAVKDSTAAPREAGPADTSAKKKSAAPSAPAKQKAAAPSAPAKQKAAAPSAPAKDTTAQDTGTQVAGGELHDQYHPAPLDTVPQQVYEGWKQFNLNCARCHGEDVLGTTIAPHLIMSLKPDGPINSKELFISTVCSGRPQKGMPAWCSLGLGMDKIEQIYTYVKGRSDGKIHPGRPAVRQAG